MANYLKWMFGAVAVVSALGAQGAAAQYYLGVEAGRDHLAFQPEYRFVNGAPQQTYDNRASGAAFGVVGGYRWQSSRDFTFDVQGRVSVSNAEWTLDLPEPASLRYDVPMNVAVALLPAFRVSDKLSVFAEAGLALGKIRERKSTTNVTRSHYDVDKWQPGFVAGFGLDLALDERWSVRAGYRRTWYKDHDFNTYRADGSQVEAVTSEVRQSLTTIGLFRTF